MSDAAFDEIDIDCLFEQGLAFVNRGEAEAAKAIFIASSRLIRVMRKRFVVAARRTAC